jgi:hypothetical protein
MNTNIQKVEQIKVERLDAIWPTCSHFLAAGLAMGEGEMDLSQLRQSIVLGNVELLVGLDTQSEVVGAMALQFINFANFRVANVLTIGGTSIVASKLHWEQVKQWLKQRGASKVQGFCQPAQARLWRRMGFTQSYAVVRSEL